MQAAMRSGLGLPTISSSQTTIATSNFRHAIPADQEQSLCWKWSATLDSNMYAANKGDDE
jgi:hypothetical protein